MRALQVLARQVALLGKIGIHSVDHGQKPDACKLFQIEFRAESYALTELFRTSSHPETDAIRKHCGTRCSSGSRQGKVTVLE